MNIKLSVIAFFFLTLISIFAKDKCTIEVADWTIKADQYYCDTGEKDEYLYIWAVGNITLTRKVFPIKLQISSPDIDFYPST